MENLDQYITVLPEYTVWDQGIPLPELSVGPSPVDYTISSVKENLVAFTLAPTVDNSKDTILVGILTALNEKNVTEKTLFDLMNLAMALKTKDDKWVFQTASTDYYQLAQGDPDSANPVPSNIGDISTAGDVVTSILNRASSSSQPEPSNLQSVIDTDQNSHLAGPYWAATFIRLISKEPESWRRAMGAIQAQFGVFYGLTSKFMTSYVPLLSHAQQIKTAMDSFRRVSRAMVAVVATTERNIEINSKSHHMFIYFAGQHLSFTGMHAYPLITMILHKMRGLNPAHILSLLTTETTRNAVVAYHNIATTRDAPSQLPRNQRDFMWKYARLINEGYFLSMQTKKNAELVYGLVLLAKKLGMVSGNEWADPEKMAALSGKRELREEAVEFCDAVYTLYKAQIAIGPNATGTDRYMAAKRGIRTRIVASSVQGEKRPLVSTVNMEVDTDSPEGEAKRRKNVEDLGNELDDIG